MLLLASVTGIWGIGFLLWFVNLAIVEAIHGAQKPITQIAALIGVLTLAFAGLSFLPASNDHVRVGAVQSASDSLAKFRVLSEQAGRTGAALVVWPEFSGLAHVFQGDTAKLRTLARIQGMPAFVTSFRDGYEPMPHNAAEVFTEFGESDPYYKRKLFGNESTMHTPGHNAVVVTSPVGRLGLNICFDSCFPGIIRDTARLQADIVALPTIDPESPYGFFAANHAAFTPIRAAENGVSMIRSDGYAFSNIADPSGRIVGELGIGENQVITAELPLRGHQTLYRLAGDWFVYLCGFIVLTVPIQTWRAKRAKPKSVA